MNVRKFDELSHAALDAEFIRAQVKHRGRTPADPHMSGGERLAILVEEIGEVARAMTYDEGSHEGLVKELIQVATMALAWVEGIEHTDVPAEWSEWHS